MAINKKNEFESQDIKLADIAKALSHPARVAIIKLLVVQGAVTCGKIVAQLPLSQSTVSQHLKELKESGLIKAKSDGVKVEYSAVTEQLKLSGIFFNHFFEKVGKTNIPVG
jgi:DNA-binding transcriptional ArsR family regulator